MSRLLQDDILWSQHRKRQLWLAGIALAVGMGFIMAAIWLGMAAWQKVRPADEERGALEYLIINKPVSALNSLSFMSKKMGAAFKPYELEALREQPFIVRADPFVANQYDINSNLQEQLGMVADLFFEAVPTAYLDTVPPNWDWQPGDALVPVIMNKDWLDLYNFNVAVMYNLPQLSASSLQKMTFDVRISGNGQSASFKSKVMAFSYRMPSLMVPASFMTWANEHYSQTKPPMHRIILATPDASAPALTSYLAAKGFEANTEKTGRQSFRTIAFATSSVAAVLGMLFTVLALGVLILTLRLLISQSKEEITLMITLGYAHLRLQKAMIKQLAPLVVLGFLAGSGLFAIGVVILRPLLEPILPVISLPPLLAAVLGGVLVSGFILATSYTAVRKALRTLN